MLSYDFRELPPQIEGYTYQILTYARVGGNQANTKLYCGCLFNTPQTDSIVLYGGAAVLAYFVLPAPYKYWVAGPLAGLALLGATCGR